LRVRGDKEGKQERERDTERRKNGEGFALLHNVYWGWGGGRVRQTKRIRLGT
jgi:hypothetical protein